MHATALDHSFRLVTRRSDHAWTLTVSGDIDVETVAPLCRALNAVDPRRGQVVVLDLSGVLFADASLVNALLHARSRGGRTTW